MTSHKSKYEVRINVEGTFVFTVDALGEDDAKEIANDMFIRGQGEENSLEHMGIDNIRRIRRM